MNFPRRREAAGTGDLHYPIRLVVAWCLALLVTSTFPPLSIAIELFGPASLSFNASDSHWGTGDLVVGDFNTDGLPDLAVTNTVPLGTSSGHSFSILLCDGQGDFSRVVEATLDNAPYSLATADFDADGYLDLAVTYRSGDGIGILLGDGQAGFSRGADIQVGDGPTAISVGGFNLDGAPDLAIACPGIYLIVGNTLSILLGDGLGGFSRAADVQVDQGPAAISVGDFNSDAVPDLAVANAGYGSVDPGRTVSILLGEGDGRFSRTGTLDVDAPTSVAVGNFNADGATDLAVGTRFDGIKVYGGDDSGNFGWAASNLVYPYAYILEGIAVGDLNADGNQDLAVTSSYHNRVYVLLGTGKMSGSP